MPQTSIRTVCLRYFYQLSPRISHVEDSSLPSAQHLSLPPLAATPAQATDVEPRSEAP